MTTTDVPAWVQALEPDATFTRHSKGGGWISSSVIVAADAEICASAVVVKKARVGEWARVGAGASVGEWARVGDLVEIPKGGYLLCALVGRYYLSHSGPNTVSIGCQTHSIKDWLGKVGADVKAKHPEVSESEWETMKTLIRLLAKEKQPKLLKRAQKGGSDGE